MCKSESVEENAFVGKSGLVDKNEFVERIGLEDQIGLEEKTELVECVGSVDGYAELVFERVEGDNDSTNDVASVFGIESPGEHRNHRKRVPYERQKPYGGKRQRAPHHAFVRWPVVSFDARPSRAASRDGDRRLGATIRAKTHHDRDAWTSCNGQLRDRERESSDLARSRNGGLGQVRAV